MRTVIPMFSIARNAVVTLDLVFVIVALFVMT